MARTSFVANPAKIKVIGLGGGGCNAITRMVRESIQGVEFIAMNTDAQALAICEAPQCVQLGTKLTKGLGAGGDHVIGTKAAEESRDELKELVSGSDMVFVGGALTIAVVTKPFGFEGAHRTETAEEGINNLMDKVDTLIIIPNDRLLTLCDHKTGVDSAFKLADDVLRHGVQAIAEVITTPGMINLDFADVKAIMKDAGPAWMSIGKGSGQNRAMDAAKEALASPLLDVSIEGSKAVLFNVVGGTNLSLFEVNQAADVIKGAVDPDANIIFGVANDPTMENEVRITLITTGFHAHLGLGQAEEEDELTKLLKGMKTEDELDVPSFLRRPLFSHRRHTTTPSETAVEATPQRHFQS
jgi:cell division protein FtsZ